MANPFTQSYLYSRAPQVQGILKLFQLVRKLLDKLTEWAEY